ncbi:penicillin-binding protein 1A [Hellea balneolensis]|uniref:penicillin-binding protein 1A n=1 Tax=Hellea balneolensis TaxID=287478 RepID=UPI0004061665|nr:penicillin-binding protein 1A [Hellea balneolensis]
MDIETEKPKKTRKQKLISAFKWLFALGSVAGVIVAVVLFVFVVQATKDLPSVETLAEYKPPVMSRVHAGDGKLISEFRTQARIFVPIESVPKQLQHAFVAAEDQRFYSHNGFDEKGFLRAMVANVGHVIKGRRLEGGSTLTQQVAKNFLVGDERNVTRKIREVVIAGRIEKAMDKDTILELYLNDIYFGRGAYGVAAASLNYFGKPMKDLTLDQMAYLAVLPKAPNNYRVDDPVKKERALNRRSYVLTRMGEDGYADEAAVTEAKTKDIVVVDRFEGDEYLAAEYFVEEARKQIKSMYGDDELYEGGLSIRTTLDTRLQLAGRKALRDGLEAFDRRHGYRGPLARWDNFSDWKSRLAEFEAPKDIGDWRVALVLEADAKSAKLGFADELAIPEEVEGEDKVEPDTNGTLNIEDIKWAKEALAKGAVGKEPKTLTQVVKAGDIILVQRKTRAKSDKTDDRITAYNLRQVPKVNGGLIAMDPHTGRVLSLVGGYSFEQSQFNRATQAKRQPGSAFKPFVYAAALDNGFTPASQVLDAPFVIEKQDVECEENELGTLELRGVDEDGQTPLERDEGVEAAEEDECERFYKPSNYNTGKFYGLSTLRLGLEKSRNAMTVRLANDIGMTPVNAYARRFGIYDETKPELAWALGAGETTLLRLATAYSALANGGKAVTPAILDRVQDGQGKTIFVNGDKVCELCLQDEYYGGPPPELPDEREVIIDPVTAYQVTFMLKGVVDNGTGFRARALQRPIAGKTGTTNDSYDTWFMGFSPDLVAGVYVGMDTPEQMGIETGSSAASPIFTNFMAEALKDAPKVPFRIPEGVTLSPVNRNTGEPSYIGAPDFILEAFRPGTEPTVGELKSTIRVGSGTDSFGSYDFDFGNEAESEDALGEENTVELSDENASEAPSENDALKNKVKDLLNEIEAASDGVETPDVEVAPKPEAPVDVAVKMPPKPETEEVEEALDEGLY